MAEDPYLVPGSEGVTPAITLPDAPGDFTETTQDKVGLQPKRDEAGAAPTGPYSVPGSEGVVPAIALDEFKFSPGGFQDTAKDELANTKAAILAYKNMPGFSNVG